MSLSPNRNRSCIIPALILMTGAVPPVMASGIEGFTEPNRVVAVAAGDSALLAEMLVSEGTQVAAGQPLAKLDDAVLQATLEIADQSRKARGRLDSAQADRRLKTELAEKLEQLRERKHASQDELDRVRVERDLAVAHVLTVQEELAIRELEHRRILLQIEQRTIRAPLSGIVIEISKQPGEFVSPVNPVVLSIAQVDPLVAVFSLPSDQVRQLQPGKSVDLTVAETPLRGVVEFISPRIEPQTGTVEVKVSIPNPEGHRPSGQRCRLQILGTSEEVAASPQSQR
ncbi:MAG: efflux RND transporter periplasmic adaptor subunit [Planctomycetaceae bacterium]